MSPIKPGTLAVLCGRFVFCLALAACGGGGGGGGSNTAPVANAGTDREVKVGSLVVLDGSASNDADADALTYSWTLASYPAGSSATLTNAGTVNPSFMPDAGGLYVLNLVVNDGAAASAVDSVTVTAGVLLPEYDPMRGHSSCTATYAWTLGPNIGQQVVGTGGGSETVNYTSGAIAGTVNVAGPELVGVTHNDGSTLRLLGGEMGGQKFYLATDCAMTAHPSAWVFGIVYDGMLLDQGTYYMVQPPPLNDCLTETGQSILFSVQDVTLRGTTYENAVVWWYIDTNFTFTAPVGDRLTELGITPPTAAQMGIGGGSPTSVDVWAPGLGFIAGGDINAGTGVLNDFSELVSMTCN